MESLSEDDLVDMVTSPEAFPTSASPAPGGPRPEPPGDKDELMVQLAQKDRDLTLAAELGKALLEKNNELSKKNEQLVEEHNQKMEVSKISLQLLFSSKCCCDVF